MTADPNTTPRSRCAKRPSCARTVRPKRAWGMPGALCTRSLVCQVVVQNAHEYSQRSHRKSPGIPARNGFNGFLRTLPGDRLFLPPSLPRSLLLENLTPASRRQDHTTSPSASGALVSSTVRVHRIQPRVRDVAIRPSSGVDGGTRTLICMKRKEEKFLKKGLDTLSAKQPDGQISCICNRYAADDFKSDQRRARTTCAPGPILACCFNAP
jgi:hypothetical protein